MLIKLAVIFLVFVIIYCLGSALYFMLSRKQTEKKMVKALTWRVVLSLSIFILLMISFMMGWLHPHPISSNVWN